MGRHRGDWHVGDSWHYRVGVCHPQGVVACALSADGGADAVGRGEHLQEGGVRFGDVGFGDVGVGAAPSPFSPPPRPLAAAFRAQCSAGSTLAEVPVARRIFPPQQSSLFKTFFSLYTHPCQYVFQSILPSDGSDWKWEKFFSHFQSATSSGAFWLLVRFPLDSKLYPPSRVKTTVLRAK